MCPFYLIPKRTTFCRTVLAGNTSLQVQGHRLCFIVHHEGILFVGKKRNLSLPMCSWFSEELVPVPMPCDQCPASTAALPCCVFDVPHPPAVSSSPKSMTMIQDKFSAGHLDTCSSHCFTIFSFPCSLFTQIPPNYLADL